MLKTQQSEAHCITSAATTSSRPLEALHHALLCHESSSKWNLRGGGWHHALQARYATQLAEQAQLSMWGSKKKEREPKLHSFMPTAAPIAEE
jgi:hypothetical protein